MLLLQGAGVWSLVKKLRFCNLCGRAKKKECVTEIRSQLYVCVLVVVQYEYVNEMSKCVFQNVNSDFLKVGIFFFFLLFCVFQTFKNEKLVFLLSSKKRIVIFFKWSSTLLKFHHSYFDLFSPDVTFWVSVYSLYLFNIIYRCLIFIMVSKL